MITKRNWSKSNFLKGGGVQLLKGGGVYDLFDRGDYVTELADSPGHFFLILIANGAF